MLKFFRDNKAGSNGITFIVIFVIIIGIVVNFVEPVKMGFTELMLTMAYKKGLDRMQQKGGLTADIENDIKNFLKMAGFDETKIQVNGTIAQVDWGEDVALGIRYTTKYTRYDIGLTGIDSEEEAAEFLIDGSTTSYYFDNNS